MDSRVMIVVLILVVVVVLGNAIPYLMARNHKSSNNTFKTFNNMSSALKNPWGKENQDLDTLSSLVEQVKNETKPDPPDTA
jgi:uncharacterized protein (UPF0333 family)